MIILSLYKKDKSQSFEPMVGESYLNGATPVGKLWVSAVKAMWDFPWSSVKLLAVSTAAGLKRSIVKPSIALLNTHILAIQGVQELSENIFWCCLWTLNRRNIIIKVVSLYLFIQLSIFGFNLLLFYLFFISCCYTFQRKMLHRYACLIPKQGQAKTVIIFLIRYQLIFINDKQIDDKKK